MGFTTESFGTCQNESEILNILALDRASFTPSRQTTGRELNPERDCDLFGVTPRVSAELGLGTGL